MSFDISALKLQIDTSQLDEAITKLSKLQQATSKVEQEVKKQGKASKEAIQDSHVKDFNKVLESQARLIGDLGKAQAKMFSDYQTKVDKQMQKQMQFMQNLNNQLNDLSNGYTKGESAILKQARALGIEGSQFEAVISHIEDLRKLVPQLTFDGAIGSLRKLNLELDSVRIQKELLDKGIKISKREGREFAKIQYEVEAGLKTSGVDVSSQVGKEMAARQTLKLQEEWISKTKELHNAQAALTPVVENTAKSYRKLSTEQNQHYLTYRSNLLKTEAAEEKSFNRRLEKLREHNSRREQSLNQMQGAGGVTTAEMANIAGQESALRRLGVGKISDLVGNREAMLEVQRAGDNAVKAWNAANRTIKSSREMAFAMRQVPMQITDIVVSLAGGQSPFQVLLQQGGQLKDLFGGVKEAAVALGKGLLDSLGSAFRLLISPVGLVLTTLTGFGAILYEAADRTEVYNKSLILLGNTTSLTLSQVDKLAESISSAAGVSEKTAALSLIELSKNSNLTANELANLTQTAVGLEKYGGQSLKNTAEAAASFAKDPVEAMQKYNKEIGFLTPELVKSAYALMDQGKSADASRLVFKAYADELENMRTKLKDNLGETATLWNNIKEAIVGSSDALIRFFKSGPKEIPWYIKMFWSKGMISSQEAITANQQEQEALKQSIAQRQAKEGQAELRLRELVTKNVDKYKTLGNKSEVDSLLKQAGTLDPELAKQVSELQKSSFYTGISKGDQSKAETERKRLATLAENYNLQGSTLSNYNADYNKKLNDINLLFKTKAINGPAYAMALDELEKSQGWYKQFQAAEKQSKEVDKINLSINEQIALQKMQIEGQTKGLALTEEEKLVKDQLTKLEENRLRILNDITTNATITPEQRDAQLEAAKKRFEVARSEIEIATRSMYSETHSFNAGWDKAFSSYTDAAKNAASFGEQAFSKMTDGMTDAIMQFVTTGKVSVSSLTSSILADILRIQLRMQITGLMGDSKSGVGGIASGLASLLGIGKASSSSADLMPSVGSDAWSSNFVSLFSANGNAFGKNGLTAFANGGAFTNSIVNNPTLFKFANGAKFGVMGEAGPEAVMPLSRDSSGRLGVTMQGGSSGDVQVVINNTGTSSVVTNKTESVDSRGNRRIELTLADAVAGEAARPGSSMYNATRNSFGLKPALVGR